MLHDTSQSFSVKKWMILAARGHPAQRCDVDCRKGCEGDDRVVWAGSAWIFLRYWRFSCMSIAFFGTIRNYFIKMIPYEDYEATRISWDEIQCFVFSTWPSLCWSTRTYCKPLSWKDRRYLGDLAWNC